MIFPAPEARQIIAHGETVGMVAKTIQAPAGATENQPRANLFRPIRGWIQFCSFTHGFTVGYFLPSLRDCTTILISRSATRVTCRRC